MIGPTCYAIISCWSNYPVEVELDIRINKRLDFSLDIKWLRQVIEKALSMSGITPPVELGVIITSDRSIQRLNKKYRGLDETTDVLSFALTENSTAEDCPFLTPPDGITRLGEIAISYPQAKKQAEEEGHSTKDEIALLLTHGVLHLAGYEHDEPQREKEMKSMESRILQEFRQ